MMSKLYSTIDVLANISGMCHMPPKPGTGVPGERDSREDGEEYSSAKTNMSNITEAELKGSILE
jgi:hypothetical protein